MPATRVPVLMNARAGGAERVRAAVERDARVEMRIVEPSTIAEVVRAEVRRGTQRVIVSGGDGTISTALGAAAGTPLAVGILPGGTLNHFARDYGVPVEDLGIALDIAIDCTARPVDLGYVNGHPILNTSSVGVYVDFVRRRELLERRLRYRAASVRAAFAIWRDPHAINVTLKTADDNYRRIHTPLVFVGIRERVLERGTLGERRRGGARALHILTVDERVPLRMHRLAFRAVVHGIDGLIAAGEIESYLTTSAVMTTLGQDHTIAVDGELVHASSTLEYKLVPGAVLVATPMKEER